MLWIVNNWIASNKWSMVNVRRVSAESNDRHRQLPDHCVVCYRTRCEVRRWARSRNEYRWWGTTEGKDETRKWHGNWNRTVRREVQRRSPNRRERKGLQWDEYSTRNEILWTKASDPGRNDRVVLDTPVARLCRWMDGWFSHCLWMTHR